MDIKEYKLNAKQIEQIHQFGECWIKDYNRFKREFWEKSLWLWAWDKKVIWSKNRNKVPV